MRRPDASLIHISNLNLKLTLKLILLRPLCLSHLLLSPRKLRRIDACWRSNGENVYAL